MKEAQEEPNATWWKAPLRPWTLLLQDREEQVFLALTLLIGALVGATVVAFIVLTSILARAFIGPVTPGGDDYWCLWQVHLR
jgi:hypothetical protein